jgi:hypothetical protein
MKRAFLLVLVIALIAIVGVGCGKKLSAVTISGTIQENGQAPKSDFPGAVIKLTQAGQVVGDPITIAPGATVWTFTGVKPGVYEVVGETSRESRATLKVDASKGSCKDLVLNFKAMVDLTGTVTEQGRTPGKDWPGGTLTVKAATGAVIEKQNIIAETGNYQFSLEPGKYIVLAESGGRIVTSGTLDLTNGRSGTFELDFEESMLYGDFQGIAGVAPAAVIYVMDGDQIIKTINVPEGQSFYKTSLERGDYRIKVISNYAALQNMKEWRVRSNGGYELNKDVSVDQSLRYDIAFDLTIPTTVSVSEEGLALGQEFPGGKIEVFNGSRIVATKQLQAGISDYNLNLSPGIYRVQVESFGRQSSTEIDLRDPDHPMTCTVNLEKVILHGQFEGTTAWSQITVRLKSGNQIAQAKEYQTGATGYWFAVDPNTEWTLETDAPELGFLKRSAAKVGQSTAASVNLSETITVSGTITENSLLPIPGEFPGGTVRLVTADGIVRASGSMNAEGTFTLQAAPNMYKVEAESVTRVKSTESDCTSNGNTAATINYTDIVVIGNIAMRGGSVPASFPTTDIEFKAGTSTVRKLTTPQGTGTFTTVIVGGNYSMRLALNGTDITIIQDTQDYRRSCKKTIFVDSYVARVMGTVSVSTGNLAGTTTVKAYRLNGSAAQTKTFATAFSSFQYEFYLKPDNYNIGISNSNYSTPDKKAVTASGDMTVNLMFTHVPITFELNFFGRNEDECHWASYQRFANYGNLSNLYDFYPNSTYNSPHTVTITVSIQIGRTVYMYHSGDDGSTCRTKEMIFYTATSYCPFG